MDWFQSLGAYSMLFNDTPALAADFTLRGPRGDFGYRLAYQMQRTPADLEVYPAPGPDFPGGE